MTPMLNAAQVERPHARRGGRPLDNADALAARLSPRERAEIALLLRADGWSWQRVANHLGYKTRGGARASALRLALLICPPTQAQRDATRAQLLAMLDTMWIAIEEKLGSHDAEEQQQAMRAAEQVINRYALHLGIPATETPQAQRLAHFGLMLAPKPAASEV